MDYLIDSVNLSIGDRLRFKRKEQKMTQKQLSSMIGVTFQQLQKYESGQSKISVTMLLKLCGIFGVDIEYFLQTKQKGLLGDQHLVENIVSSYDDSIFEGKVIDLLRQIENKKLKLSILSIINAIVKGEASQK